MTENTRRNMIRKRSRGKRGWFCHCRCDNAPGMLQSFFENHLNGHYRYWGEISRNKAKHDLHRSRLEGKREWFCHCSTRRWNQQWADNMRRFQKCDVFRSSLKIARNWAVCRIQKLSEDNKKLGVCQCYQFKDM